MLELTEFFFQEEEFFLIFPYFLRSLKLMNFEDTMNFKGLMTRGFISKTSNRSAFITQSKRSNLKKFNSFKANVTFM